MKKSLIFPLVFLMNLCMSVSAFAQSKSEMEEQGYAALNDKDFATAYSIFDKLNAKYPKEFDYKFKLGISALNYPEKKQRAIDIFTEVKKESKSVETDYYLGKAYHINYRFKEAIPLLETFISAKNNSKNKEEKEMVTDAKMILDNCNNGIMLIDTKVIADIKNIGAPINTDEDQYVPAITTDESIIVFTYRGKKSIGGKLNADLKPDNIEGEYHEDVYISRKSADSTWSVPVSIGAINTNGNDASIALSPDGQLLFIFLSTDKNEGDILVSKLTGTEFSTPIPLNKNINTDSWEGSCSISGDGRQLYFASERPGGLGGRDIYLSENINGEWGPAKNLGPSVNTPFDDDAPFIHPDGITLFFSSKGHQSIGGYDIMFSVKKDNEWLAPKSMGLPLNTTEDDRYYVINSRGDKGFFSSNRAGSGGLGKQDIYMVTPGILGDKPIIALLKGVVYGDDKPVEAKIEVLKIAQQENIGPYYSNNISGKYLMALSPGSIYRIKVVAAGFEPLEEDLDIESLNKYMETIKDFYLYSPGKGPATTSVAVTPTTSVETNTIDAEVLPCATKNLPDFGPLKGKSLNDIQYYNQLLNSAGDYCAQGLVFKVQIAAYRKPQNYKYTHLTQFGKPEVVDYPDGITRFTQLEFKTIKEAEVQRQKAIAKGQKDAWIVAFINGKRYTLEDLIMVDFLGKSIN
ncbi:MAG: PD40 domain-containing protein [Bacteroidetes bacterium]|nr:PD40 domain-containing protein [Bacteroidota bacterium]